MLDQKQLLEGLTDAQREAVTHVDGPLLIVAAAGSGKTRVITRRVAYLISQGIPPSSIVAITFTNKAAGEMKQRVSDLMRRPLRDFGRLDQPWPTICTFHSLCLRILRHYAPRIGLPLNFSIYDAADQTRVIKDALKTLDISSTNFAPASVHATISNAKNQLRTPEEFAAASNDFYQRTVARVYAKYQQLLTANNALDFDDLLLRTTLAMREHKDILEELQQRFGYILIDEYQDTNHAQYVLAHALAMKHRNICVVGDPDQCLPPRTMVQTPTGATPIDQLKDGDAVTSGTGWSRTRPMPVERFMSKPYAGPIVRVRTSCGDELPATPNHIVFARIEPDPALHYTYLMYRRGVGYRIGTTRGVRTSKDRKICSGLQVRTNQEVADAVWVLRCTPSAAEARYYEQFFSVRYGIPTMVFFVRGRRMDMTQEWIDRLYDEIKTDEAAERLMDDLRLDRRYPHHRPGAVTRRGAGILGAAGVSRRHVLFTAFGDGRSMEKNPWHEHRVQLVTSCKDLRAAAEPKFRVRDGARGTWRIETSRRDYDIGLSLARDITALAKDVDLVSRARLTPGKAFHHMPISHLHRGMIVPVLRGEKIEEAVVESVAWEEYDGPVYDLSIANTRNYSANGIIVHNSIYAWRGADIRNILEFEKDYADAKVVKLEQNYRSTKTVLQIADALIAHNTQRKKKSLWTENEQGERATLILAQDEYDEAQRITELLKQFHDTNGLDWNRMAVFYRMNALSRVMEKALFDANVPYQIARGVEFYNRKEIKDVLAYLRVVANPADEVSLTRILNVPPRGLGDTTVKSLQTYATASSTTLFGALEQAGKVQGLSTRAGNSAAQFVGMVNALRKTAERGEPLADAGAGGMFDEAPKGLVQQIMEDVVAKSGYEAYVRKSEKGEREVGESAMDNVSQLITAAAEYDAGNPEGSLQDYLANVSLVSDADHLKGSGGAVTLMTLHAAKGLEFPVVAMIGLEEGCLPHSRSRGNLNELEEERRLCFVGITRAQQRLIMSKAAYRTMRGLRERTVTSPFLNEMPPEAFEVEDRTSLGFGSEVTRDEHRERLMSESQRLANQFRRGQMVRHPTFGVGRIVDVSDMGQHTRAVVEFNAAGRKTLILQYARLEAVG